MTTGLFGPHPLTKKGIDDAVEKGGIGAYALGSKSQEGGLIVERVGRSDFDLNNRLHDYEGQYTHFKYAFYPTKKAAYEKECELYHDFSPRDNILHPDRPTGTDYTCPRNCGY